MTKAEEMSTIELLENVIKDIKDGKYKASSVLVMLIEQNSVPGAHLFSNAYVYDTAHHCMAAAGQCIDMMGNHIHDFETQTGVTGQYNMVSPKHNVNGSKI